MIITRGEATCPDPLTRPVGWRRPPPHIDQERVIRLAHYFVWHRSADVSNSKTSGQKPLPVRSEILFQHRVAERR